MLFAVSMLAGAVVLWLVIDWWLWRRDERKEDADSGWMPFGSDRDFQQTGWEETLPPAEADGFRTDGFQTKDDRSVLPT